MGEEPGVRRRADWGRADYAPLADPTGATPEDLCASPCYVAGRDPYENAGGVGPVLQPAADLDAVPVHADASRAVGVRVDFEVIQAAVREHGDCHGQRAGGSREPVAAPDCDTLSAPVCCAPAPAVCDAASEVVTCVAVSREGLSE